MSTSTPPTTTTLDDSDKLSATLKLAELWSARHDQRRKYEYGVSLGLSAALLIAASRQDIEFGDVAWWIWAVFAIGFIFLWIRGTWVANYDDKSKAKHYFQIADDMIAGRAVNLNDCPNDLPKSDLKWWFGFLADWSNLFQTVAIIAAIVIGHILQ